MSREFIREDYLRLDLEFTPLLPAREVAIAYLSELDFEVFESTDIGVVAYIPANNIDREKLAEVKEQLNAIAEEMVWSESTVKTENWNAKWEESYDPVNVEDKAMVRAPFHTPPKDGLDIVITPNMSFGTGHHDTTWMMLKALLSLDIKGERVLDMGCGTGVLAIAAKKLGASNVLAIDIEEGAVGNTLENAVSNSITADSSFVVDCGTSELLTSKYTEPNQIILANINRNVLISDLDSYYRALATAGTIVFSGFFVGDVDEMKEQIHGRGLDIISVINRNDWACIICGKTAK